MDPSMMPPQGGPPLMGPGGPPGAGGPPGGGGIPPQILMALAALAAKRKPKRGRKK